MSTLSEVEKASLLEYFGGDELASDVFVMKYALRDENGNIIEKTPDQMHRRLAREFARIESKYPNPMSEDEIYSLFENFKKIVPQGSPMAAIGNPYQVMSASNCYVIDSPLDSYGGILFTDQQQAQLMKRRAGVGFDISNIRPKGMQTNNAAKTTDGIAVFMERFSNTCREVAQNGRRGALMLTISCNHPEIETFINIKRDLKKVTGANISIKFNDEFMSAVDSDSEFTLRWPVDAKVEDAKFTKIVKAKEIWDQFVDSAWASAEPGALFWDTVQKSTPADIYENYRSISTNPCLHGDTLIAVADGRNAVTIKQLAEEGMDVPVYSIDPKTGDLSIQTGRNPRVTGHDQELLRVTLDDGTFYDVTPNHRFLLRDGSGVEAKDLEKGMSLSRFDKLLMQVKEGGKPYYNLWQNQRGKSTKKIFEHRLFASHFKKDEWDEKYLENKKNGWMNGGLVIHHKDYNGLNNSLDNLQIMSFKEHAKYHAEHDKAGKNNGRAKDISNEEIKNAAIKLTKKLGRRFSHREWEEFAKEKGLIQSFSSWRQKDFYSSPTALAKACAAELNLENIYSDPRIVKTLRKALTQKYDAFIDNDNNILVQKCCESCGSNFVTKYELREASFCSASCLSQYVNGDASIAEKRRDGIAKFNKEKSLAKKDLQAKVYSQVKFALNRRPLRSEWEDECKKQGVPFRTGKNLKYCFSNWSEVIEAGEMYNHKVKKVEKLNGLHTVYNITVDNNHTYCVVTPRKKMIGNEIYTEYSGVGTFNCGEIVLSGGDSCRLMVVNMLSFVKNPFTDRASFDFDGFIDAAAKGQRLMDDLIDIELELIEKIQAKINSDSEPDHVKRIEKDMWEKIYRACRDGRRTGLGITALGDTLAALGIQYGSEESIEMTGELYRALAIGAYTETVKLAKERGAFPEFRYDLEKDHSFLNKVISAASNYYDGDIFEDWERYGRRNIALTTTAPTGSVSCLTQTTSGIEPAYLLSYKRRRKIMSGDEKAEVMFVDDLGDKWTEYTVYHHGFKQWMDINNKTAVEDSPYFKSTSNDIDWVASVDIQAAAQEWICHSISKTCLSGDSLIETNQGLLYMDEISDASNCKEDSYALVNDLTTVNHFGNEAVIALVMDQGKKKTFRITTESGSSIVATEDHRFIVIDEYFNSEKWLELKDLSVGTKIRRS
jgi:ribonucleotide reductase alpha subunit